VSFLGTYPANLIKLTSAPLPPIDKGIAIDVVLALIHIPITDTIKSRETINIISTTFVPETTHGIELSFITVLTPTLEKAKSVSRFTISSSVELSDVFKTYEKLAILFSGIETTKLRELSPTTILSVMPEKAEGVIKFMPWVMAELSDILETYEKSVILPSRVEAERIRDYYARIIKRFKKGAYAYAEDWNLLADYAQEIMNELRVFLSETRRKREDVWDLYGNELENTLALCQVILNQYKRLKSGDILMPEHTNILIDVTKCLGSFHRRLHEITVGEIIQMTHPHLYTDTSLIDIDYFMKLIKLIENDTIVFFDPYIYIDGMFAGELCEKNPDPELIICQNALGKYFTPYINLDKIFSQYRVVFVFTLYGCMCHGPYSFWLGYPYFYNKWAYLITDATPDIEWIIGFVIEEEEEVIYVKMPPLYLRECHNYIRYLQGPGAAAWYNCIDGYLVPADGGVVVDKCFTRFIRKLPAWNWHPGSGRIDLCVENYWKAPDVIPWYKKEGCSYGYKRIKQGAIIEVPGFHLWEDVDTLKAFIDAISTCLLGNRPRRIIWFGPEHSDFPHFHKCYPASECLKALAKRLLMKYEYV